MDPVDFSSPPLETTPREKAPNSARKLLQKKLSARRPDEFRIWVDKGASDRGHLEATKEGKRRLFRYTLDASEATAKDTSAMVEAFKQALSTDAFEKKLNEISQHLYQRKAEDSKIQTLHDSWGKELEDAYESMKAEWVAAEQYYKIIPLLDDPKKVAEALTCMITLEAVIPPLTRKYDELADLLESPQHREALEFYKVTKRKCKAIKTKRSTDERVQALQALLDTVSSKIEEKKESLPGKDRIIVQETALLYEELLRFMKYTATTFKEPIEPESYSIGWTLVGYGTVWGSPQREATPLTEDEMGKLDLLVEKIALLEGTLTKSVLPPTKEAVKLAKDDRGRVAAFMQTCEHEPLSSQDDFRNGRPLATWKVVGPYKELAAPVAVLRNVARALSSLEKTVKLRRNDICEGQVAPGEVYKSLTEEAAHYEMLVKGLIECIKEQEVALTKLPLTNRIHAGWYYIARLLVKANDVKCYIEQLKKLSNDDFISYATAIKRVIEYLAPEERDLQKAKDYFKGAVATERLWEGLKRVTALEKPRQQGNFSQKLRAKIYEALDQILAKSGPRTLEHTFDETRIASRIFAKEPLDRFREPMEENRAILPKMLLMYLLKGFLKSGYFTTEEIDPQFDLTLHILETDPQYRPTFIKTLEQTISFRPHYEAFLARSDMPQHREELALMATIVGALLGTQLAGPIEMLLRYCQARQALVELKESKSSQQQLRHYWLIKETNPQLLTSEIVYPSYFADFQTINTSIVSEASLYKLITICLYAKGEPPRAELLNMLEQIGHIENHYIRLLLQCWALQELVRGQIDSVNATTQLLHNLFTLYLSSPESRQLWEGCYGLGFMEVALVKFCRLDNPHLNLILDNQRGTENKQCWQKVLEYYEKFLVALKNDYTSYVDGTKEYLEIHKLIYGAKALFVGVQLNVWPFDTTTYLGISRWCVIDMATKYIQLRYQQFVALLQRQGDANFITGSADHKKAETLIAEIDGVFAEQLPLYTNTPQDTPLLQDARRIRYDIARTFQSTSISFNL